MGEHQKSLASADQLHGANQPSEAQIQLIWSQVSSHPAELEAVRPEISRLEACLEAGNCQSSASHVDFTAGESDCDQHCALADVE